MVNYVFLLIGKYLVHLHFSTSLHMLGALVSSLTLICSELDGLQIRCYDVCAQHTWGDH